MSKKLVKYWLPVVLWALLIFFFSSKSLPATSEIYWRDFIVKKTAHVIEYGILAVLLYRAFRGVGREKGSALVYSFFLTIIYAASDEFHQSFIPGRESRLRDVLFDTIGGGGALYWVKEKT